MDKKFQEAKAFVTDTRNRTTVMTVAGATAVVAGIIMFIAKRGKAKQ